MEKSGIGYKRIGKYYREAPGCPEFLGLRVDSSPWCTSEPYDLLLEYLDSHPYLSKYLQRCQLNDLDCGLAYMNAVEHLRKSAYEDRPGLREVHQIAEAEGVYAYGSWDDHVERVEFYREHTLLSCGSPRFYKVVADRLLRQDDVLRRYGDCALLYYTLARVSIENDEMMQDAPERALNKVFTRVKANRNTDRTHVELIFSLQQTVLDGLEYLEENQRELPIWGIPPFDNHQVIFHPDHAPPADIRALIQHEMDLIDRDFDATIRHWRSLKSKVDRHLDVLLQFRVLEQQELAISQRDLSTKQQKLAIEDAKSTRVQSRSVLIFTALTIIFLPLSFFTSYFGMNLTDLAKANHDSKFFWMVCGPISGAIVIAVFAIAKILSVSREPDEEEAVTSSADVESETCWRPRLKMRKGKVKNS
jgi:Mg2+ and Co2+ transporter CorA